MRREHDRDADETAPHRSQRALRAVAAHVQPGSFPLLLAAALFNYVLNGVAPDTTVGAALVLLGHVAVIGASLYVLSESRLTVFVGSLLIAVHVGSLAGLWLPVAPNDRVLPDATASAWLLWVLAVVLRDVFRPATTDRDAVVGALCGFVIILNVFMRLHGLIEASLPGSYRIDGPPLSERSDLQLLSVFQYFSTVTLTTVGFGDIVPVTPAARLVTGLESIVGQAYLAVVVATLVSRVAARRD
jgi:voltage-gated potassium channel Kch